ncbi:hypothetical protein [Methanothermococcus sp.]|uniref:hypothetical protein n=1 Tax=Methanothermococcus sp. TaxID=2614238 RepID=UPI0025DF29DD|nr:hypothetical protein [Methanothermococcus sp.]
MNEYERAMERVKKYLKNRTPEQIKRDLVECGWHEIEPAPIPIYNLEFNKEIKNIKICLSKYDFEIQNEIKNNNKYGYGSSIITYSS